MIQRWSWANRVKSLIILGFAVLYALPLWAEDSASVLMYHRFGEEADYPSTSITMEQFKAHIEEIKTGGYTVLSVPDLVDKLKKGEPPYGNVLKLRPPLAFQEGDIDWLVGALDSGLRELGR